MKLRGLVPNFYIHVSVNGLYIPTIGPPIFCSKIGGPVWGYIAHGNMNVEIEKEATQFHFWEYFFRIIGTVSLQCRLISFSYFCERDQYTVNLGLVSMNYLFRERNLIYLHGEDKVRS